MSAFLCGILWILECLWNANIYHAWYADSTPGRSTFIFKSSTVKVSVKKKPVASEKEETKQEEKQKDNTQHDEDKCNIPNNGLLSLGQQYDSDDEDD